MFPDITFQPRPSVVGAVGNLAFQRLAVPVSRYHFESLKQDNVCVSAAYPWEGRGMGPCPPSSPERNVFESPYKLNTIIISYKKFAFSGYAIEV